MLERLGVSTFLLIFFFFVIGALSQPVKSGLTHCFLLCFLYPPAETILDYTYVHILKCALLIKKCLSTGYSTINKNPSYLGHQTVCWLKPSLVNKKVSSFSLASWMKGTWPEKTSVVEISSHSVVLLIRCTWAWYRCSDKSSTHDAGPLEPATICCKWTDSICESTGVTPKHMTKH